MATFPVRVLGGPTAFFEYGGLGFLTDPTFDAPGEYVRGGSRILTKTAPPAASPADLGRIDVVLLSHDEHPDNLDNAGRALLADVPLTLTTPGGGERLGVKGLADWESVEVDGRHVRGRVPRAGRAVPGLVRELDRTDVVLDAIEVHRPTLDDVFLSLTGRSLRDADTAPPGEDESSPPEEQAADSSDEMEGATR